MFTPDLDWIVLQREGTFIDRTDALCKVQHKTYFENKAHCENTGPEFFSNNCQHNSIGVNFSSELPPVKKRMLFLIVILQSHNLACDQKNQY